MAGLLDFMYSGQVNVKYEDLPKFLKVAEIMQIKGLHTEVTNREWPYPDCILTFSAPNIYLFTFFVFLEH